MNTDDFLNGASESYLPIPSTHLSLSSYGKIKNNLTGEFYGFLIFMSDVEPVLSGALPIWHTGVAIQTKQPRDYFKHRSPTEKQDEAAFLLAA